MPRHDPNDGAVYRVIVTFPRDTEAGAAGLRVTEEWSRLGTAKARADELMDADLDGDCYGSVEVWCERNGATARCYRHQRGESELRMRRALLALRRSNP